MNIGGYISIGAIVGVVMIAGGSYMSAYNLGNRSEKVIQAQYEQNQNSLSAYSNKVMEAVQIPNLAKDNLKEVIQSAMQGRYGDQGSKAVFQSIKEAYPGTVDPALYTKIQIIIDSGRTDFAEEQKKLIDKVRVYRTNLDSLWTGTWLGIAGYPKINLEDYKIIKSDYANDSFKSGIDKGLKIK